MASRKHRAESEVSTQTKFIFFALPIWPEVVPPSGQGHGWWVCVWVCGGDRESEWGLWSAGWNNGIPINDKTDRDVKDVAGRVAGLALGCQPISNVSGTDWLLFLASSTGAAPPVVVAQVVLWPAEPVASGMTSTWPLHILTGACHASSNLRGSSAVSPHLLKVCRLWTPLLWPWIPNASFPSSFIRKLEWIWVII